MYEFEKEVLVKDFSCDTKDFLVKIGFDLNDNIAEMLKEFAEEKGYVLDDIYESNIVCTLQNNNVEIESVKRTNLDYGDSFYCKPNYYTQKQKKDVKQISKTSFIDKLIKLQSYNRDTYLIGACGS